MQPGSVFLVTGTADNNATALTDGAPRTVEITKTAGSANGADLLTAASPAPGPGAQPPPA
jgi:hypothetical protein